MFILLGFQNERYNEVAVYEEVPVVFGNHVKFCSNNTV